MLNKIDTVVFPVAGMGTRFLPATKAVPKEMLPVVDKPPIQWAVEEAAAAGCTRFVFVTSPEKGAIMNHFGDAPHYQEILQARGKTKELALLKAGLPENAEIIETYQDQPLGLGHAIWCAREATGDKPFAVILPDDMVQHPTGCLSQMAAQYQTCGGNLVAVENVPADQTHRYGVLDPGAEADVLVAVKGLVEKPSPEEAPSNLAVLGRYILPAKVLDLLKTTVAGVGGEIQLTDALDEFLMLDGLNAFETDAGIFDCGNKQGFLSANLAVGMRDPDTRQVIKALIDKSAW